MTVVVQKILMFNYNQFLCLWNRVTPLSLIWLNRLADDVITLAAGTPNFVNRIPIWSLRKVVCRSDEWNRVLRSEFK